MLWERSERRGKCTNLNTSQDDCVNGARNERPSKLRALYGEIVLVIALPCGVAYLNDCSVVEKRVTEAGNLQI